jgi:hypothetical protein
MECALITLVDLNAELTFSLTGTESSRPLSKLSWPSAGEIIENSIRPLNNLFIII